MSSFDLCRCGVFDDLDEDGLCIVCSSAPHDPDCICDECDEYWTAIQNGVDPRTWRDEFGAGRGSDTEGAAARNSRPTSERARNRQEAQS